MNIKFDVTIDCCLKGFTCDSCETEIDELVIPAKVDGKEVSSIGGLKLSFSKLEDQGVKKIKKIKIEDGIREVKSWAFANIKIEIDELHWPSDCEKIPEGCFYNTPLKEIHNLDLAKEIGEYAFAKTNLKTITWPANYDEIPRTCFFCTPLKEIQGINNVKKIGEYAFAKTNLKTITWPSNCDEFFKNCFFDSSIEEITFPAGGIKDIDLFDLAFSNVDIKKIDLSAVDAVNFIRGHLDVDYKELYEKMKEILCLPYYVSGLE